jgi:tetratricopeptide (TPR) repeat protein
MRTLVSILVLALICSTPFLLADDEPGGHHHHDSNEKLGTVSFPISCAPAVQKPFERAVALLHSFEYEKAEEQFAAVGKQDPSCAMAHWGIAMSQFHQLWERPEGKAQAKGLEESRKAQSLKAKTPRERGYVDAIALFYADGDKQDFVARATAYSQAMEKVYEQNPNDTEAGAFYALSLLASEAPKDDSLNNPRKAIAVLDKLYAANPDHPGLAHYLIHAADKPQLAPLALNAARRYAAIAPSSAHAVHMPSHIFARLGLWDEDIQSNLRSVKLTQESHDGYMRGHELHAMHFLEYAYLQTGQNAKAKQIVDESKQIVASAHSMGSDDPGMMRYYGFAAAHFPAMYVIETRRWPDAMALQPMEHAAPLMQAITYWARTIASARSGDVKGAEENAKQYDEQLEAVRKTRDAYMFDAPRIVSRDETHAWLDFAEKKNDDALALLRAAADYQDKVGKQEVDIPAREMLADMLLQLDRPQEALAEYETSLKTDPSRFNGLYGAARSAELAHEPIKANAYYAQLLKNCGSESDRPELARAREAVAKGNGAGN